MAKLIVLALAFAALVAFASAYTSVVTTTFDDENPIPIKMCRLRLLGEQFNQCQRFLQQQDQGSYELEDNTWGQDQQGQGLQQCCNELQRIDQQCQCEAVQQVFQKAQQMQGRQGGQFGSQKIQQLKQKAQNLPNQCNLRVQSCPIRSFATIIEDNHRQYPQQSCRQIQRQRFQQCQRYIQQAQQGSSFGPLLMSVNRQGQQFQQGLQQCCNELERVQSDCQCEALQQVYRQAQQQQQPQPWSKRGSRRGGQQQQQQLLRPVFETIRNQCNLQVQQCPIPSGMF